MEEEPGQDWMEQLERNAFSEIESRELEVNKVKKRKTMVVGGHSVSITERQFLNENRRQNRYNRRMSKKRFSKAFRKEFADVLEEDEIYKPSIIEKPAVTYPTEVHLPVEVRKCIGNMTYKYRQSENPSLIHADEAYCRDAAHQFLQDKTTLRKCGISEAEEVKLCNQYIEFALFTRTVRGGGKAIVGIRDFIKVVGEDGILDPYKMQKFVQESEYPDNSRKSHSLESLFSRLETFIEYTLETKYADQAHNNSLRDYAYSMLEEAAIKYGIDSDNLDSTLKVALQHIEYGMSKAYSEARKLNLVAVEETHSKVNKRNGEVLEAAL